MASKSELEEAKKIFGDSLSNFVESLAGHVCTTDGQWAVKGFVDIDRNVFSISSDTKVTSKILEIQIFPELIMFADKIGYELVLTEHQNHYPDMSFVSKVDDQIKFAVDLKTTYRKPDKPFLCNDFTLGSHGAYFQDRTSHKNIRFPYGSYGGHFCLGLIYERSETAIDETKKVKLDDLESIASVMRNMVFFVVEKWRLASDRRGSGNTANIGSIELIEDVVAGRGIFADLGEEWFDDYWMNYDKITINDGKGGTKTIRKLADFIDYRGGDVSLINKRRTKA
ncbi:hypothetical protein MNBD_ALPHA04-390 [hydrothermal vent metagenome]|uniref:Restriction endonuclease n=1 Tax=hydrothermal vent metagenome TaxID=652676 RepID=A0A3B0TA19_9ZZZZ